MSERRVTHTSKGGDGDITALCNPASRWCRRLKPSAIHDIETGRHTYFVDQAGYRTDVRVVEDPSGKHLRTTADLAVENSLDQLPDCREALGRVPEGSGSSAAARELPHSDSGHR